jgi:hypothetical protein
MDYSETRLEGSRRNDLRLLLLPQLLIISGREFRIKRGFGYDQRGLGTLASRFFDWDEIWRSFDQFLAQPRRFQETESRTPTFRQFTQSPRPFLDLIFPAIARGEYRPQPARALTIYADKHRTIHQFAYPDEFVLRHFARLLSELSEPLHSDCLFSFRKGRGSHLALARARNYVASHRAPVHVVRRDVRRFGETLRHDVVKADFAAVFSPTPALVKLLDEICRFRYTEGGDVKENSCGLPSGANLQLVFENLYLRDIDRELENKAGDLYLRFGDDILYLTESPAARDHAVSVMSRIATERGLTFSESKSADVTLLPPHAPELAEGSRLARTHFEYLGMQLFHDGRTLLPRRKQRKIQTLLRQRMRSVAETQSEPRTRLHAMIQVVRQLVSTDGPVDSSAIRSYILETSDDDQLRALDKWVALEMLRIAYQTGFRKGNFRLHSFEALRAAGLPSFLHLRRARTL